RTTAELEQRSADSSSGTQLVIRGHAAVFDSPTVIVYAGFAFEEVVGRGAFRKYVAAGNDMVCQADHEGEPLGRLSNSTLTISEDTQGVAYECLLPDTQHARDTWQLVKRGDYPGCSFTFMTSPAGERWDTGVPRPVDLDPAIEWWGRRYLLEFEMMRDLGPVTWPAYADTDCDADEDSDSSEDGETAPGGDAEAGTRSTPVSNLELRARALKLTRR
ncbi:MAG: HK97 family phage prohead protease, partial [Thermoleophilia bacterium]|nr:HK97 family phage prohead protease [Thermoleophilia bacterium]